MLSDGTTNIVYGIGNKQIQTVTAGVATWCTHDHLGSTRQTLTSAGAVLSSARYDAWGAPVENTTGSRFGFTGELTDNGLVYLRARWYNPATGVFLSRDPFPGVDTVPQSLHPYAYTHNNPVNATDPSGMCVAYGNNECALITSWDAFDASFPYDYPYDPAISAANATVSGSRFGGRGGGAVTLRQAAEMAAMYDVFTANPGRFGYESWHYREAEVFSVTFLRKPLLMGSALGSPDALLAELNALDACLGDLKQEQHERRWQLLIVLGMGTGRDGVFAPDTGGGGGGGQGRSDLASGQSQLIAKESHSANLLKPVPLKGGGTQLPEGVVWLRIDEIDHPPWNPPWSQDKYQNAKDNITHEGYDPQKPIVVVKERSGRYTTMEGNHRFAVVKDLGYDGIPARVKDLSK